eukprot:GCRY01001453.1.p1 GENE.GCRY01001453.1~~GCRY01001453.1.p1  ORF type:complete len:285 (-),score=32.66 GCRY01001453.1:956-1810(-)
MFHSYCCFFLLFLLALNFSGGLSAQDSCSYIHGHYKIDLSSLKMEGPERAGTWLSKLPVKTVTGTKYSDFYFGFCGAPNFGGLCDDKTAVCQNQLLDEDEDPEWVSVGRLDEVAWSVVANHDGTVVLWKALFSGGISRLNASPNRAITVTFNCSSKAQKDVIVSNTVDILSRNATFTLFGLNVALPMSYCQDITPPPADHSLSWGSLVLISAGLIFFFYFFAGIFVNILMGGTTRHVIPQYDFWSNLPSLIADGLSFCWRGILTGFKRISKLPKKSGSEYESLL